MRRIGDIGRSGPGNECGSTPLRRRESGKRGRAYQRMLLVPASGPAIVNGNGPACYFLRSSRTATVNRNGPAYYFLLSSRAAISNGDDTHGFGIVRIEKVEFRSRPRRSRDDLFCNRCTFWHRVLLRTRGGFERRIRCKINCGVLVRAAECDLVPWRARILAVRFWVPGNDWFSIGVGYGNVKLAHLFSGSDW